MNDGLEVGTPSVNVLEIVLPGPSPGPKLVPGEGRAYRPDDEGDGSEVGTVSVSELKTLLMLTVNVLEVLLPGPFPEPELVLGEGRAYRPDDDGEGSEVGTASVSEFGRLLILPLTNPELGPAGAEDKPKETDEPGIGTVMVNVKDPGEPELGAGGATYPFDDCDGVDVGTASVFVRDPGKPDIGAEGERYPPEDWYDLSDDGAAPVLVKEMGPVITLLPDEAADAVVCGPLGGLLAAKDELEEGIVELAAVEGVASTELDAADAVVWGPFGRLLAIDDATGGTE